MGELLMKKGLKIILGLVVAFMVIRFGVVKFYIEPNLDTILADLNEGFNEAIEDNSQTADLKMEDLLDDLLRLNEKTLTNKKIKEKYDIDKLKEKGSITFECSGLEYNEEFGEISLYVTKYPAR